MSLSSITKDPPSFKGKAWVQCSCALDPSRIWITTFDGIYQKFNVDLKLSHLAIKWVWSNNYYKYHIAMYVRQETFLCQCNNGIGNIFQCFLFHDLLQEISQQPLYTNQNSKFNHHFCLSS